MIGTANMSGGEYSLLTDGTNTYISGGAGGNVYIRGGDNDSNPQITVSNGNIGLAGVPSKGSEATAIVWDGTNIGYRELGSAAFSATSAFLGATAKAADSNKLDNLDSTQFLRSDASDSYSGDLSVNGITFRDDSNAVRNFKMQPTATSTDVGLSMYLGNGSHSIQLYGTANQYGFLDGNWANWDIKKTKNGAFEVDEGSGLQRVFNAGYHPNADILTTARTIAGTSFNGSANIDINYNNLTNKPTIPSAYSLPEATATVRGGIELFSNTDQSVAANSVSATSGRTYGIQLNSAGQAVVNVPWSDTNTDTNTTYTAGSGLTLSGTEFSHSDTSSQSSSANSGRTYIQSLNLDGNGHVTGLTTATETVVNTDTTYSVGDGGLTQKNFTTTLKNKLDGIAASANNYVLPTTISGTRNFSGLISANAGLRLGDNDKIQLGDSQDLEINHYSVGQITNKTGDLYISSTAANTDIICYAAIGATPTEFYRMNGGTGKNTFSRPVDISGNLDVNGTTTSSGFQTDTTNTTYNLITRNSTSTTLYVQAAQSNSLQTIASFRYGSATANGGTETFRIRRNDVNVFGANFTVGGSITGNSKNFSIPHPTKEGKRLVHSCLEGPEIGVYFRGRSTSATIEMPDYWDGLVHLDSMTVELTAVGPNQDLYVASIADDGDVTVGSNTDTALNYFYVIYGERKDLERLEVEIDDTVEVEESLDNSEDTNEI
jgi:hypothetical protein